MTSRNRTLILDADVLIAAYRNYYAPDICPGFWECITYYLTIGQLLIIDRVRDEIQYPAGLVDWVKQAPEHAQISTATPPVVRAYRQVMDWVFSSDQFTQAAKDAFARKADPWLVAHAMANDVDIVTNEVFNPNVRRDVKIPNVCRQFDVEYRDTYSMLRGIGARFDWRSV